MTATTRTRAVQTAARLDPRSDAELLGRFLASADHHAFATLVERHGPLVLGVCRRALGATADADDAFQATFLVLVKRAAAIPWRANLGPWLYGVAHRVSAKARFRRDRRFALEKQVDAMPHPETCPTEPDDLSRLFDEELAKLPEEMRRAVVLCELQGMSRAAAAKQLRISEGTLSSRLGRARKKLAAAFAGRGFKLAVPVAVGVSVTLAETTARAATDPAGAVPAAVSYLVQEALTAMTISKLKLGILLAAVAVGCTWAALAAEPKPLAPPTAKADGKAVPPPAKADTPTPVATVNGEDISRVEFGEYLIRKYGAKEVEAFVNQKVIEQAAANQGVRVTDADMKNAVAREVRYFAGQNRDFHTQVLTQTGHSEEGWNRDVLRPQVLLEKLCSAEVKVKVTDEELRTAFAVKYGGRRHLQVIEWPKGVERKAVRDLYERAKREPLLFDLWAVRVQQYGFPDKGESVLAMYDKLPGEVDRPFRDAAMALKTPGEVSDLIETDDGAVAIKLIEIVPAQAGKKFEDVKADLLAAETHRKVMSEAGKRFVELKKEAKPVYHLQPDPKTYSVPLPKR